MCLADVERVPGPPGQGGFRSEVSVGIMLSVETPRSSVFLLPFPVSLAWPVSCPEGSAHEVLLGGPRAPELSLSPFAELRMCRD